MSGIIKREYRFIRNYYHNYKDALGSHIKLFNYLWNPMGIQNHWLTQFITKRNILKDNYKDTIAIFSVNGDRRAIKIAPGKHKIFYTAENVHVPLSYWQKYEDLLLTNKSIDLSLGFDDIEHSQYLRFPFWIMNCFPPDADYKKIQEICTNLNRPASSAFRRSRFCALVCRDDYFGERIKMLKMINSIDRVDCAGAFMNNTNEMKTMYKDNKAEFLTQYQFNLCPENSNHEGYVTEKIFEAIHSGCIPIYWGSNNNPEPDILNHQAICFISNTGEDIAATEKIQSIYRNKDSYLDFASQNRLKENAPEIIYSYYERLDLKLKDIFQ